MSADLIGLPAFQQEAAAIAADVETRARAVAAASAERVAEGIRARVHHQFRNRLRAAVTILEAHQARQFTVGFDDAILRSSGLLPMVPVWHEFGTKDMPANPAVGQAVAADRPQYLAEMKAAITGVLEGHSA